MRQVKIIKNRIVVLEDGIEKYKSKIYRNKKELKAAFKNANIYEQKK